MNRMNVIISASEEYSKYSVVMLLSLFRAEKDTRVTVYYFYNDPIDKILEYIERIADTYGNKIIPMQVNDNMIGSIPNIGVWNNSTVYRWLCLDLLPKEVDRAIVLGIDTLYLGSIKEFYNQEFDDSWFIMCNDMCTLELGPDRMPQVFEGGKQWGINPYERYCNADVVLLNLKELRKNISYKDIISNLNKFNFKYLDQDVLNFLYNDHIKIDDYLLYNFMPNVKSKSITYEKAIENVKIMHYTMEKPWNSFEESVAVTLWQSVAKETKYYSEWLERNIVIQKKKVNKFREYYKCLDYWLELKEKGLELRKEFSRRSINSIAIYGNGVLCDHLITELENTDIAIQYIIDRGHGKEYRGITVLNEYNLSPIDAVIVTPLFDFDAIKKNINEKSNVNVLSLFDLIESNLEFSKAI